MMTPPSKRKMGDESSGDGTKKVSLSKGFDKDKYNQSVLREANGVPWIDNYEFRAVGDALLSATTLTLGSTTNTAERDATAENVEHITLSLEDALKRVDDWKVRSSRPLPASLESTAALSLALWRETQSTAIGQPAPLHSECRMLYSTAIIRSINGLADPFQQNRAFASSVAEICSQIGVPTWLVDVRHDATHNQMPSLSTLRNSAITLLNYFKSVYWDPILQIRNRADAQIRTLLDDYVDAAEREKDNKSQSAKSDLHSVSGGQEGFFDFGEDHSDNDGDGPLPSTRLGTNANMFAVLMDTKKKKKPKTKTANKEKQTNESRTRTKRQSLRSPAYFVERLLNSSVPLDVVWNTTIDHLLFGASRLGPSHECASLVPHPEDFPCTDQSIQKLRQRFDCLFSGLGKTWPGLMIGLLITIIDHLLVICDDPKRHREAFFLESWAKYLVSFAFFVAIEKTEVDCSAKKYDPAPTKELQSYGYPLTSLLHRLKSYSMTPQQSITGKTIGRLRSLFVNILDDVGGPDLCSKADSGSTVDSFSKTSLHEDSKGPSASAASLSLDQMEELLAEAGPKVDVEPSAENGPTSVEPNTTDSPVPWTKCETWEVCSIGCLPGYPL